MTAPTAEATHPGYPVDDRQHRQPFLHAILGRPDLELVGVYAHGADKVGLRRRRLCSWPEPTGVKATNDIEELIALTPDACCYNPLWQDVDELSALLEAGINVVATAAWITGGKLPRGPGPHRQGLRGRQSTIFGSGAHPGITNMVGMVLSDPASGSTRSGSPSRWTARPTSRRRRRPHGLLAAT